MESRIWKQAAEFLRQEKKHRRWIALMLCLAMVVTLFTNMALTLQGESMSHKRKELSCPLKLHEHTEDCYDEEGRLICGYADYVVHTHNDDCYDTDGALVCKLPVIKEHEHDRSCYEEQKVLACGLEEQEPHHHTEACISRIKGDLICGKAETDGHSHSEACYDEEQNLICGQQEQAEHHHTDDCYQWEDVFNCGMQEGEGGHTHSDRCYETVETLTCGELELHEHTDQCYDEHDRLICGKVELLEHIHNGDCFDEVELTEEEVAVLNGDEGESAEESTEKEETAEEPAEVEQPDVEKQPAEVEQTDVEEQPDVEEPTIFFTEGTQEAPSEMPSAEFAGETEDVKVAVVAPEGAFPAGTTMKVEPVEQEQVMDAVSDAVEGQVVRVKAVDITFFDAQGQEIQPQTEINVTMTAKEMQEKETPVVVHVEDDGNATVVEHVASEQQPEEVSFETDSFSIYALAYTVDFYYGEYEYHLPGEGEILLSELFGLLNIPVDVKNVVGVVFSNPELVRVEQLEDDWKLTSLQAFDTQETLTITFADGNEIVVRVTDASDSRFIVRLNDSARGYLGGKYTDNTGAQYIEEQQLTNGNTTGFTIKAGTTWSAGITANFLSESRFVFWLRDDGVYATVRSGTGKNIMDYNSNPIDRETTFIAYFAPSNAKLAVIKPFDTGRGSVSGGTLVDNNSSLPQYCYSNSNTVLTAAPKQGYFFKGWYVNGECVSTSLTFDVSTITSDIILEPVFEKVYTYTVKTNGDETFLPGYLVQSGNGHFDGNKTEYTGTTIPAPGIGGYTTIYNNTYPHTNSGYEYVYWVKDDGTTPNVLGSDGNQLRGSGGGPAKNLLDRDTTYIAFFAPTGAHIVRLNWPDQTMGSVGHLSGEKDPRSVHTN